MISFQDQFADFKLNEELKIRFLDFESGWETKQSSIKSYRVITIVNNDITDSEPALEGGYNAKLA